MSAAIKLSTELINEAKIHGAAFSRSTPKQIEYWSKIGKIAEENPELSYNLIKDILLAKIEKDNGKVEPYEFG